VVEGLSRKVGRELIRLLGGPAGTYSVHIEQREEKPVIVVEVTPGRKIDPSTHPKVYSGLNVIYRLRRSGTALAG
jgi:hypothetical protein